MNKADLSCLDYFEEFGRCTGQTVRIFRANDVRLLLHLKVATLAGIEDPTDARFPGWGAELAREALLEREEMWDKICAYHPNIKFLFKALMRE